MAGDKGRYSILTDAVMLIRADITYGPRLSNCWLPASTLVEALRKFDLIEASLRASIDVRKFNTAMLKSALFGDSMNRFDGSNNTGVFRIAFYNTFYYYFTEQSRQIKYPCPLNRAWIQKVMEGAASVLVIPNTRARPTHDTIVTTTHVDTQAITAGWTEEDAEESPNKKARVLGDDARC